MSQELSRLSAEVEKKATFLSYVELSNELESLTDPDSGIPILKVAILRNFTIEPVLPILKGEFFLSAGLNTDFYIGDFDTVTNDVMNPASGLYAHEPALILVAQWFELLSPKISHSFIKLSVEERKEETERIIHDFKNILTSIRRNSNAPVIINNFPLPDKTTLGVLDLHSIHSQKKWFLELNDALIGLCSQTDNVFCMDLGSVLSQVGYDAGYNQRQWEVAKAPLAQKMLVPFAQEYGKFVRALNGKAKKCLVLDCDGTLWGGILGEDGPAGIKLGNTYPGSSYVNFQKQILNLYNRGVILAICSKNNEEDVLDLLETHENMILKKHHLANWQINWEDKASNIRKIAKELNIGLDSLVFADDNEFECEWIKKQLPEVKVLHLHGEPAAFQNILARPGLFDSLSFSEEDKRKTEMYISEKKRNDLLVSTSSYTDYLIELNIHAVIQKAQVQDYPRVSQLTQKTNQFNLTTVRYTEADIKQMAEVEQSDVFSLKVSDKISDLGLVAVGIIKYEGDSVQIDSFLMSCRALGRGLENALLAFIINEAILKHNIKKINGRYVPTKKNIQTKDFYEKNHFRLANDAGIFSDWELNLDQNSVVLYPEWITINDK